MRYCLCVLMVLYVLQPTLTAPNEDWRRQAADNMFRNLLNHLITLPESNTNSAVFFSLHRTEVEFGILYASTSESVQYQNVPPRYFAVAGNGNQEELDYSAVARRILAGHDMGLYGFEHNNDSNNQRFLGNVDATPPLQDGNRPRRHSEDILLNLSYKRMRRRIQPIREIYLFTYRLPCEQCTEIIRRFLQRIRTDKFRQANNGVVPRLFVGFYRLCPDTENTAAFNAAAVRSVTLDQMLENDGDPPGCLIQLELPEDPLKWLRELRKMYKKLKKQHPKTFSMNPITNKLPFDLTETCSSDYYIRRRGELNELRNNNQNLPTNEILGRNEKEVSKSKYSGVEYMEKAGRQPPAHSNNNIIKWFNSDDNQSTISIILWKFTATSKTDSTVGGQTDSVTVVRETDPAVGGQTDSVIVVGETDPAVGGQTDSVIVVGETDSAVGGQTDSVTVVGETDSADAGETDPAVVGETDSVIPVETSSTKIYR